MSNHMDQIFGIGTREGTSLSDQIGLDKGNGEQIQ